MIERYARNVGGPVQEAKEDAGAKRNPLLLNDNTVFSGGPSSRGRTDTMATTGWGIRYYNGVSGDPSTPIVGGGSQR